MKGLITDIQRFSLNDGPGIRTTVFFKGCNMKCPWCHNPETLSKQKELLFYSEKCIGCGKCFEACPLSAHVIVNGRHTVDRSLCRSCGKCAEVCYAEALMISGREMTVEQILAEILRDKAYYEASGGGVTLSGGEVLCHFEFACALAKACREEGIPVAIESNLSVPYERIQPLLSLCDVVMTDIKLFQDETHRKYTGLSNQTTLENIQRITTIPLIVRTPLVEGITATEENLRAIAGFLSGKENLLYYQLLNFNPLGDFKYRGLDAENAFAALCPYTDAQMHAFGKMLSGYGIRIKVGE